MELLFLVVGFLLGLLVMYGYMKARDRTSSDEPDNRRNPSTDSGQARGLISEQQQEKEQNLEEVMRLFDEHNKIDNNLVENTLGVSDATASRYLTGLEEQGKIEQIGKEGRHVSYKKVQ